MGLLHFNDNRNLPVLPMHRLLARVLEHIDAVLVFALYGEKQGMLVVGIDVVGEAARIALGLEDALTGIDVDAACELPHLDYSDHLLRLGVAFDDAGKLASSDGALVVHESVNAVLRRHADHSGQADEPKDDIPFHSSIVFFHFSLFILSLFTFHSFSIRCTTACISGSSVA